MTPPIACEEHELVAAVRRGDDRAFEELFSRYRRRITAYVARMLGDGARAEDVTQDVFIAALRRIRATDRPIAFKPWIYEIAKNACIDEFRRVRRSKEIPFEDEHDASAERMATTAHEFTPHGALERKQRLDDLCGAFVGLSESHHRILVLRELEGRSYLEIGEQLGMTRPMVESTLFRARRRLSEEYDDLVTGRRCETVRSLLDSSEPQALRRLGVRDRRRLARHLSHCHFCRQHARAGGVDESMFKSPRPAASLAALIALPFVRWRRGGSGHHRVGQSGSHSIAVAQSLPNVARVADPLGPSVALGRAVAAVAAVAIASAGGGIVSGLGAPGHGVRIVPSLPARPTPARRSALAAALAQAGASPAARVSGVRSADRGPGPGSTNGSKSPGPPSPGPSTRGSQSPGAGLLPGAPAPAPVSSAPITYRGPLAPSGSSNLPVAAPRVPSVKGVALQAGQSASSAVEQTTSQAEQAVSTIASNLPATPGP